MYDFNEKKDFYYSPQMERHIQEMRYGEGKSDKQLNVEIEGQLFVYTECVPSGESPIGNFDDFIYVGTARHNNIKIGQFAESIRTSPKITDCCEDFIDLD